MIRKRRLVAVGLVVAGVIHQIHVALYTFADAANVEYQDDYGLSSRSLGKSLPSSCQIDRSPSDVFLARHTLVSGFEMDGKGHGNFIRVQDLLLHVSRNELGPMEIPIDLVCHKDMHKMKVYGGGGLGATQHDTMVVDKPNDYITDEEWTDLWLTCGRKLTSHRIRHACPEIPGIVVAQPPPDSEAGRNGDAFNNPCMLPYRMVDGAHRICKRKSEIVSRRGDVRKTKAIVDETKAAMFNMQSRGASQGQLAAASRLVEEANTGYEAAVGKLRDVSSMHFFVLEHMDVVPLIDSERHGGGWPAVSENDTEQFRRHMQHVVAELYADQSNCESSDEERF